MVRVSNQTIDQRTAWRVRDALARHPSLSGSSASIDVLAYRSEVILAGWAVDDHLRQLALRLARRTAGHCVVQSRLRTTRQVPNR